MANFPFRQLLTTAPSGSLSKKPEGTVLETDYLFSSSICVTPSSLMIFSVLFLSARFECLLASPDIVWFLTCITSVSLGLSAYTKQFSVSDRVQTFEAKVKRIGGGGGQGAGKSYLHLSSFPLLPFFYFNTALRIPCLC